MVKLDKVIAGLECCADLDRSCESCSYDGAEYCEVALMKDALELLRTLHDDVIGQSGTILYLNRDLERCRLALNAQGEYMYLGGDLISREALMERIELIDWYGTNCDGVLNGGAADEESAYVRYADVARVIADALAVEAEPVVHAHWKKEVEGGMYWYVCSACGAEAPYTRWKSHLFSGFCPYCGAHMDEEVVDGT